MDGSLNAFAIDLKSLGVKPVSPVAPGGEYSRFCSFADWESGGRIDLCQFENNSERF